MNINKDIAEYFLNDAKDFLDRYNLLSKKSPNLSWRSKLLIELLFSLECAIKATIFIESKEDQNLTYKNIRKGGHKLAKLYEKLSQNSKDAYDNSIKIDLNGYTVDSRYMLDGTMFFSGNSGTLDNKYYETIASPTWMANVYSQVATFVKYADTLNPYEIKIKKFSEMNPQEEMDKYQLKKSMVKGNK